jgi:hypothetical protein
MQHERSCGRALSSAILPLVFGSFFNSTWEPADEAADRPFTVGSAQTDQRVPGAAPSGHEAPGDRVDAATYTHVLGG